MSQFNFEIDCMRGSVLTSKFDVQITGIFNDIADNNTIYFVAPNPPDYRQSFSGSGLPFFSREQAFQNTPNKIRYLLQNDNTIQFNMLMPNAFYDNLGNNIVTPHITMNYKRNNIDVEHIIKLDNGIPFRTLTYPDSRTSLRQNATFYHNELPVRSQEQIIKDSQFNMQQSDSRSFWGLKPPM